jgi:hypothetical protein
MIKSERIEYWNGLREELRRSKAADTVEVRDFHLDRAGAYADRLAQDDDISGIGGTGSSAYIDQALCDIDVNIGWKIPL